MSTSGKKFFRSFVNASEGLIYLFKSQVNARVELLITCLVIVAGVIFKISYAEWIIVLLCIALVLGLEAINTAIEILTDKLHPGHDLEIGKVKDVAAGAVLVASVLSAVIGLIIFAPRLLSVLHQQVR